MNIFKQKKDWRLGSREIEINLFPNKYSWGMQGGSTTNFNEVVSGWNWKCYGIKYIIEVRVTYKF
jgi:hypothetical protein